jgi:hypothetical protein
VVLKIALHSAPTHELALPDFHVLYVLPVGVAALNAGLDQPTASVFRQDRLGDWVFTPEVSLGPACRSHAPPFFS